MLPTYNEIDNVKDVVPGILSQHPDIKIVAVDDNSPDGTGQLLDELALQFPERIHVLHRHERGRGTAGVAGFNKALELGAEYIIEMDADGSHDPKYINDLLKVVSDEGFDIAIGSRYISEGGIENRNWWRNITSDIANFYNRLFLSLRNIRDTSGGYKCYKRKVLDAIDMDTFVSKGYSIGAEILHRAHQKGFKMKEIPIVFYNRNKGKSKAGMAEYFYYLWTVFIIWVGGLINIRIIHLIMTGIIGAAMNIILFLWMVKAQNLHYMLAGSASVFINMLFNLLSEKIYAATNRKISERSLMKFIISLSASVLLNNLLLWLLIGVGGIGLFISATATILMISVINFVLNRAWVFASAARAEVYYREVPPGFYEDQLDSKQVGRFRAWYHKARYRRFNQFLEGQILNIPDVKIVDLGCGSCNWNINEHKVTGVDINLGMLQVGKRAGRLDEIIQSSLDHTGLPASSFDVVIASEVLEHMNDPVGFLKEVGRILKPGGKFLVTVPYDFFPSPFYILFNIHCFIKGYIFGDEYYKQRCGHVLHFRKRTLRKLLAENRFLSERIFIVNTFLIYCGSSKII